MREAKSTRFRLTPYQIIVVVAALICALLVLRRSIQSQNAYHLYEVANSPETNIQAVDRLAAIKSEYATGLLFELAKTSASFSNQNEAILRLGESRNPRIADELSRMLQPHEALGVQNAVSNSLARMDCETQCMSNVLHYLERGYYGEHNEMLDRTMVRANLADIQNAINDNLKAVLTHNPGETLNQLIKIYGLDSPQPSKFAVLLAIDLRLSNACPSLVKAQESIVKYEKLDLHWKAPVKEAIERLDCKQI